RLSLSKPRVGIRREGRSRGGGTESQLVQLETALDFLRGSLGRRAVVERKVARTALRERAEQRG
ncbi:MAG: hypothetical protein ACREA0_15550, partial [bacterium]